MRTESDMFDMPVPTTSEVGNNLTINPNIVRCCVLLPKKKLELHPQPFANFLKALGKTFGGYMWDREVSGFWLDEATGIEHYDRSIVIVVAMQGGPRCFDAFKKLVAKAARDLGELAIFVAVAGGPTFFVWAALPGDDDEPTPCSELIQ